MNLVLFGPPGAGKGTQAQLLCEHYRLTHISTGDLLRSAIRSETDLGKRAKGLVQSGQLVPDEIVIGIIGEVIKNGRASEGYLFDGFPRTVNQADALADLFSKSKLSLSKVIFLEVDRDQLVNRLTGRRSCGKCGAIYHIQNSPPNSEGVCDKCGGPLNQRADDCEDVVKDRLNVYLKNTLPLKDYYLKKNSLTIIDGHGTPETIFNRIASALES